jgi:hypothetical protein
MKRCEDCRHSGELSRKNGSHVTCERPGRLSRSALAERSEWYGNKGACGPDAKNFEPKEATP